MNIEEFIDELKALEESEWSPYIDDLQFVRLMSNDDSVREFCPITAVCYDITGDYYEDSLYPEAAERIGLPTSYALTVVSASDRSDSPNSDIRDDIINALGIEE